MSGRGSSRSGMRTTSKRFLDWRICFITAILLLVAFFSFRLFSGSSDIPIFMPRFPSPVIGFPPENSHNLISYPQSHLKYLSYFIYSSICCFEKFFWLKRHSVYVGLTSTSELLSHNNMQRFASWSIVIFWKNFFLIQTHSCRWAVSLFPCFAKYFSSIIWCCYFRFHKPGKICFELLLFLLFDSLKVSNTVSFLLEDY